MSAPLADTGQDLKERERLVTNLKLLYQSSSPCVFLSWSDNPQPLLEGPGRRGREFTRCRRMKAPRPRNAIIQNG